MNTSKRLSRLVEAELIQEKQPQGLVSIGTGGFSMDSFSMYGKFTPITVKSSSIAKDADVE